MIPIQLSSPVKRPPGDMIISAQWLGPDDDLSLEVSYYDEAGMTDTISFLCANSLEGYKGDVCMPSSADSTDIDRDTVVAHLRMGSFLASAQFGTFEWDDLWLEQEGSKDLQLACGNCSVVDRRIVSDATVDIDIRLKGENNPVQSFLVGVDELTSYSFSPSTQLKTIAGAVKRQFPNYVHEYPSTILSQAQRIDISEYVELLEIWV